jgi:type VI protein secretion system component VasF
MKEKTYNELSQALRALAETAATGEAGPRVEAALLQAMRQSTPPEPAARVLEFPARRRLFTWRFAWAAAALLLLSCGWYGWRAWRQALVPQPYVTKTVEQPPAPEPQHVRGVVRVI